MTEAPWLTPGGDLRCFLCETRAVYPGQDKDPDWVNVQLRDSHRVLWSKPLPDGRVLQLSALRRADYLMVVSLPGSWTVGSDNFATTHANSLPIFSGRLDGFADRHLCALCSIGGYIVFPNQRAQQLPTTVNENARPWSLNQARGMERRISDRFDLTLEAIRLSYEGVFLRSENPIGDVIEAYRWWFDLFGKGVEGFRRYAEFFFLTPMLDSEDQVKPFGPLKLAFDRALPKDDESAYNEYIVDQLSFVQERNQLIQDWLSQRK